MRMINTTRSGLTTVAGALALGFGVVHVVVAPADTRREWSRVAAEGWWNTVTLAEPTTWSQAERARAFWCTFGSFGAPMVALGAHVLWASRRGHRVPRSVGWTLLAWGLPFVVVLPASPGWVIPLVGGLIIAGDAAPTGKAAPTPRQLRPRPTVVER